MKKILLLFSFLLVITFVKGQNTPPPQAFKYQAIVRDNAGNTMNEIMVGFQITIKTNSCDGSPVYQEDFTVLTNNYGLVNLTSLSIEVSVNGNVMSTTPWTRD